MSSNKRKTKKITRFVPLLEKKRTSVRDKQSALFDKLRRVKTRQANINIKEDPNQRAITRYLYNETEPHLDEEMEKRKINAKFTFTCPVCNMSGFYRTIEEAEEVKKRHDSGNHSLS